jgi:predicted AAA+ superfamily ATPase
MVLSKSEYIRRQAIELSRRLREPRRFIQVVSGPRQVGKTTLVLQTAERGSLPFHYASADEPTLRGGAWIDQQWQVARDAVVSARRGAVLLILDEVQKAPRWAEAVKRLWDEDTRARRPIKLVLLGSAPMLMQQGLSESLAGRFEILHVPHWSFDEMRTAFGWTLDQYLYFGAYPGAAPLAVAPERWARYVRDALIETTIARDVLLMARVDKPALLRRLFDLGTAYSGQILSFTKMLGQLQDAGNTVTLAHYLDLLAGAGMITGLDKYAGAEVRRRAASPKLQVFNTALMTAQAPRPFAEARGDTAYWGRLVESAVGAHLANAQAAGTLQLFYWRDRNREVDFVARAGRQVVAIEVKSGRERDTPAGTQAFLAAFPKSRALLVGDQGIPLTEFLSAPASRWFIS